MHLVDRITPSRVVRSLVLGAVGLTISTVASASPIFKLESGSLTVTKVDTFGTTSSFYDVRGLVQIGVTVGSTFLGSVTLVDLTGGTDPDAQVLPFGNSVSAVGPNSGISGVTGVVVFDFNAVQRFGSDLVIPASVTILPSGGIPDPALAAFAAGGPENYGFSFRNQLVFPGGNLKTLYSLSAVQAPVPEPGVFFLCGGGILGCLLLKGSKRRLPGQRVRRIL